MVCPDCGRNVGDVEAKHGDFYVHHPSESIGHFPFWTSEEFAAQKAVHGGYVPPRSWHDTYILNLEGAPDDREIWFDCRKHGRFVLTAGTLRKAEHARSSRLPARRVRADRI